MQSPANAQSDEIIRRTIWEAEPFTLPSRIRIDCISSDPNDAQAWNADNQEAIDRVGSLSIDLNQQAFTAQLGVFFDIHQKEPTMVRIIGTKLEFTGFVVDSDAHYQSLKDAFEMRVKVLDGILRGARTRLGECYAALLDHYDGELEMAMVDRWSGIVARHAEERDHILRELQVMEQRKMPTDDDNDDPS